MPHGTGAPAGATPMTPIIGRTGTSTPPGRRATPSTMGTISKAVAGIRSRKTPNSGLTAITPCGATSMRSTSTESTSPGAAPSTKTGPVAGLMRAQSTASGASPGARTCPAKQSAVSSADGLAGAHAGHGDRRGRKAEDVPVFRDSDHGGRGGAAARDRVSRRGSCAATAPTTWAGSCRRTGARGCLRAP